MYTENAPATAVQPWKGQIGASATQPQPTNINTLLNDALNRLAVQIKATGELAWFLGHRNGAQGDKAATPAIDNPSVTDKLHAFHQLLGLLEENVAHIQERVG